MKTDAGPVRPPELRPRLPQEQVRFPYPFQQLRQQQQMQEQDTLADPENETAEQARTWLSGNVDDYKSDEAKAELAKKSDDDAIKLAKTSRAGLRSKRDNPYGVPDKFLKDGKPDYAAVTSSYREIERNQFRRREEITNEVREELRTKLPEGVPASPADYKQPSIRLPDGREVTFDEQSPMFSWFKGLAHKHRLPQAAYEEAMKEYARLDVMRGPKWDEEAKALGDRAEDRLNRVDAWAQRSMPQELYEAFATIPASAKMVKLWEHVMEFAGEPAFATNDDGTVMDGPITKAVLQKMMADPKYWKERDASHIAKVRAGFKKLAAQK